jgi:hypothetical protein
MRYTLRIAAVNFLVKLEKLTKLILNTVSLGTCSACVRQCIIVKTSSLEITRFLL